MQTQTSGKRAAARAAVEFVHPGRVLGVGTGSTVALFIEELGVSGVRPSAAVSTSDASDALLRDIDVTVVPLEALDEPIEVYVDGADEVDPLGRAIKGGGGAHTREKRVAKASTTWICIVDDAKVVPHLGYRWAVPLEVEADRLHDVHDAVAALGGLPTVREGHTADSGNPLVDVSGLDLDDPATMESRLEAIDGVVACGIFAHRRADVVIVGHTDGGVTIRRPASTARSGS
jgi:ribose 5-phosphate isomerase A